MDWCEQVGDSHSTKEAIAQKQSLTGYDTDRKLFSGFKPRLEILKFLPSMATR